MSKKSYIPLLAVFGAIMLVVVAAIAPSQLFPGRDFVYAQTSTVTDNATLSGLSLSGGVELSPAFADTMMTYSARAASGTNQVTVTTESDNPQATVTISPSDQDSGTTGDQVLLRGGQNRVITVTVRSEDRTVTETYTVTVYQERTTLSDNDNLSALSLNGVTLSTRFASSKTMYTGRAAYTTDETTVSHRADIGAMVAISAETGADTPVTEDSDDAAGYQVDLPTAGAVTTITVTVTAEDGGTPAKIYMVEVYRENLVKSDNASLDTVTNDGLELTEADGMDFTGTELEGFTDSETSYLTSYPNVRVEDDIRAVTVAASPVHPGAVAVISPSDQDSDNTGHQVNLTRGAKTNITVEVTAEDGTTKTYSITIYRERRVPSNDDTLSMLNLSDMTLSPAFDSGKTSYIGRVEYSTDKTTVSYRADIGAMLAISAALGSNTPVTEDSSDAAGYQVDLAAGGITTITASVTAEDGGTPAKTYMVEVYRENLVRSDDPSLAETTGLTLTDGDGTGGTITVENFTYAATIKPYPNVRVANGVSAVTVAVDTEHDGAVAVITPSDQDSLSSGHQVLLGSGAKTDITVEVTAEDETTTDTYSVTIYRERRVLSDDTDLSALSLSGMTLSPEFASNKASYMGRAEYTTAKTTVSYTADIGAEMVAISAVTGTTTVTEDSDDADGYQVDLTPGAVTTITMTVTAENDTSTTAVAYAIMVYRENLQPSDDARLAAADADPVGLTLMDDADSPTALDADENFVYMPTTKSYPNVRVENAVHTVTVDPATAHPGAMTVITPPDQDSLSSGHQVVLGSGAKTDITVEVTAEDGTTTETYSITIYRERRVLSDNADLSALSLSGVTLSPAFDPGKPEYTGTAAYSTDNTTVSSTADVGARMVAISAVTGTAAAIEEDADTVASGYQVGLTKGHATVITVMVTAEGDGPDDDQDPDTKNYKITVYRDAAPSSDATLQTLALSGITLSPAFDPATTAYTAEVETLEMTTVEAMATHPGATVEGTGMKTLTVGENVIMVTVTAEDETTETYTVTVTVMMEGTQTLLEIYDTNTNGRIDRAELREAIIHYIRGDIDTAQMREVIILYIRG